MAHRITLRARDYADKQGARSTRREESIEPLYVLTRFLVVLLQTQTYRSGEINIHPEAVDFGPSPQHGPWGSWQDAACALATRGVLWSTPWPGAAAPGSQKPPGGGCEFYPKKSVHV